jgi:broad specificity phosphatase PhoE
MREVLVCVASAVLAILAYCCLRPKLQHRHVETADGDGGDGGDTRTDKRRKAALHRRRRGRRHESAVQGGSAAQDNILQGMPASDQADKTVLFIRHGQCAHNVNPAARWAPDPAMTAEGVRQVSETAARLLDRGVVPQLIVTSPMLRCLESTALLLEQLRLGPGLQPRVVVAAACSERWSARCDTGSSPAVLRERMSSERFAQASHWPGFPGGATQDCRTADCHTAAGAGAGAGAGDPTGAPVQWPLSSPATDADFSARVAAFADWLATRPETVVIVVSHGGFLQVKDPAGRLLCGCCCCAAAVRLLCGDWCTRERLLVCGSGRQRWHHSPHSPSSEPSPHAHTHTTQHEMQQSVPRGQLSRTATQDIYPAAL